MAIGGFIVGVVSAGNQARQAKRSRVAQEKANKVAEQEALASRRRQREKAFAEGARARAKSRADRTSNLGVGGTSSATQQAIGGITTQLSSNLGFLQQQESFETQRFGFINQANRARSRAATQGAIGGALSSGLQQF